MQNASKWRPRFPAWPPFFLLSPRLFGTRWPPRAASARGVLCVSGVRGRRPPNGTPPTARARATTGARGRAAGYPHSGSPGEGQPRGVPGSSEARPGRRRRGRSDRGDGGRRRAVREGAEGCQASKPRESSRSETPPPCANLRGENVPSPLASPGPVSSFGLASDPDRCACCVVLSDSSDLPGVTPDPLLARPLRCRHAACFRTQRAVPSAGFARHTVRHQGGPGGGPRPMKNRAPSDGCGVPSTLSGGPRTGIRGPLRAQTNVFLSSHRTLRGPPNWTHFARATAF